MKMKKVTLLFTVVLFALVGCAPLSVHKELEKKYVKMRKDLDYVMNELSSTQSDYNRLPEAEKQDEPVKSSKSYDITESDALEYLIDYFDFYNRDYAYRDVKVRRVDDNVFIFSYLTIAKSLSWFDSDEWDSEVKTLTVNNDGTYSLEENYSSYEITSQSDNTDVQGDEGSETGELDARALYGTSGGGGGCSLDLAGWVWDFIPKPQDTSDEYGRIVFEIKVDDQGEVIGVRTLEKTVSPKVEQLYRKEVESLTFSPTSANTIPAPVSSGKITFIIKVK